MSISNEELEILKQAGKIISKYVSSGKIPQESFDNYEQIIDSIMDEIPNKTEATVIASEDIFSTVPYRDGVAIEKYIGFDETVIRIPESIDGKQVLALQAEAFYNANHIVSVEIPNGVTCIGDRCFELCSKLEKVTLPDTLKAIGNKAFSETALTFVNIPDSVYFIGCYAFAQTPLETVYLPLSLYTISSHTFWCCEKLTEIFIPEGIIRISESAFENCFNLSHVSLPNGLEIIGRKAFFECSNLKEIEIPNTVTGIHAGVFGKEYIAQSNNSNKLFDILPITIRCAAGSFAQKYARDYGLALARSEVVYSETYRQNDPVYYIETGWFVPESAKKRIISDHMLKYNCQEETISEKRVCFKTSYPEIEDSCIYNVNRHTMYLRKIGDTWDDQF